mgnify:CR=1 FL=1
MRVDSDAGDQPPDWVATRPGSPCLVVPHASPSDTASFLDNHTARSGNSAAIWKPPTQHRRSLAFREHSRAHISRRGRGRACTFVRFWECGWEDLRDGCAAFLVFRVGSARTLMRKDASPRVGARRRTPHRGGTHTMKVPPLSERPDTEEDEQAFLTPPARRKKRSLAARRAALRPWAIGIGLTVLVAVASVGAYRLAAGIASWNENPSAAATPTVHPAPVPTASSEPPMSSGYEIGPDGVLMRPAEFAADTYTEPELPEAAKENTERGAEAAAEHYLALLVYAWNTGDTQPFADMSSPRSKFASDYIKDVNEQYANGWNYGMESNITYVLRVEPIEANGDDVPEGSILVKFRTETDDGTSCTRTRLQSTSTTYKSTVTFIMTWKDGGWKEVQGRTVGDDED